MVMDDAANRAVFSSLSLTSPDRYFIGIRCVSTPPLYDIDGVSSFIDVFPVNYIPPKQEVTKNVKVTFDGDFDKVAYGLEPMFGAALLNKIRRLCGNVTFSKITTTKGNIISFI